MKKNSRSSNRTSRTKRTASRSSSIHNVERNRKLARSLRTVERAVTVSADIADSTAALMHAAESSSETLVSSVDAFEQGFSEVSMTAEHLDSLLLAAERGRDTISEILFASEDIMRTFDRLMKLYNTTTALIPEDGQGNSRTPRDVGDVAKTVSGLETIIERASGIAEKFDVASLNASLEAGRGKAGTAPAVIAEATRSSAVSLLDAVREFSRNVSDIKKAAETVTTRRNRVDERLRTVTVLAKSIRTAIDDIRDRLETFRASADVVSLAVDDIHGSAETAAEDIAELGGHVDEFTETLDSLSMLHELTVLTDTGIADISGELVSASVELTGAQADTAGDILELCDSLRDALGQFKDRMALRVEEYDEEEDSTGLIEAERREMLKAVGGVSAAVERTEVALGKAEKDLESFRERFADAGGVLKDMSLEFQGLCREEASFRESLEEMRVLSDTFALFSTMLLDSASRCETLVLVGSLEKLRDNGESIGGLITETGGIASELASLRADCADYGRKIGTTVSRIIRETGDNAWTLKETIIRELVADLTDLENESVRSAGDGFSLMERLVGDCGELSSTTAESAELPSVARGIKDFLSAKESATGVADISYRIDEQLSLLEKCVGRLYDDEEDDAD